MNVLGIDWSEVVRRAFKYFFEGLAVGLAAFYIQKNAKMQEVLMVALVAAATFAILDLYAPTIAGGARLGAGLVTGGNIVGGF